MTNRFVDKHILVTGGASGLGFEIARQFGSEGALLTIFDYNELALQKATEELTQSGYQVNPFHVDVSVQPDVIEAIAAVEKIAPIEVLVNNAGICLVTPFLNITKQEWHKTLDINLTGAFYVAQSVCRHMAKRKRGVVLNMSSKNGLDAEFGHTHYNASKAGLLLLTKTIAIELAHLGIRANAVCPGYVRTPINYEVDSDEFVAQFAERYIPIDRVGKVTDVAPIFLFLASDEAAFITGQAFVIDGGQLAGMKAGDSLLQEIRLG